MEVKISKSTRSEKKMMAVFYKDNVKIKTVHFGNVGYEHYSMHKDEERKKRYLERHKKENWNDYMTAGSLAYHILWSYTSIKKAQKAYAQKFGLKLI
jgi:hypothetical protein